MEFEYDRENNDCVAFIRYGSLYLRDRDGGNIVIGNNGVVYQGRLPFDELLASAGQKFYPGDKVTITF